MIVQYWPEIRAVILVVSDKEKDTSSTFGMETSRKTSPLLAYRAAHVVQPRLEEIEKAYLAKDFETFGRITMQDSNQFHAVCLDTFPPIFYMNDTSRIIMSLVRKLNELLGGIKVAYTFDAGPNAVIYTTEEYQHLLFAVMAHYFPAPGASADYCNKPELYDEAIAHIDTFLTAAPAPAALIAGMDVVGRVPHAGDVKYIYLTKAGPGPQVQPAAESLLDPATGNLIPPGPKHKRMVIKN